jgi:hypothetical protein
MERIDQCVAFDGVDRSALNDGGNLVIVDRARSARTVFIQKALNPVFQKAPTPFADSMFMDANSAATTLLGRPSAQRRMIRQRSDRERATR